MESSQQHVPNGKKFEKDESQEKMPNHEEVIYWIQICISVIFGISTYYLLEIGWPFWEPNSLFMWIFNGFGSIFILYLIVILGIPFFILLIGFKKTLKESLIGPLRSIGTQIMLCALLCGVVYMLNI